MWIGLDFEKGSPPQPISLSTMENNQHIRLFPRKCYSWRNEYWKSQDTEDEKSHGTFATNKNTMYELVMKRLSSKTYLSVSTTRLTKSSLMIVSKEVTKYKDIVFPFYAHLANSDHLFLSINNGHWIIWIKLSGK